jgi:hypothetical protein
MNPRRSIMSDEDVKKVLDDLMALPKRIEVAQNLIDAEQFRISQITDGIEEQLVLDNIKAETYFEVKEEKDPETKKPKYTNAEERDAQVMIRCNKDSAYIDLVGTVARAKRTKAEANMHLAKLINQVKYLVAESYALKAVAGVIAGLSVEEIDNDALVKLAKIKAELSAFIERMEVPRDQK